MFAEYSAYVFAALTSVIVIFQAGLAAGMPWGAASMGGRFPGKYPLKMRFIAVVNLFVLSFLTMVVLSRAGLLLSEWMGFSRIAIWFISVFYLAQTVMNVITPSKIERIWAPLVFVQFLLTLVIAFS